LCHCCSEDLCQFQEKTCLAIRRKRRREEIDDTGHLETVIVDFEIPRKEVEPIELGRVPMGRRREVDGGGPRWWREVKECGRGERRWMERSERRWREEEMKGGMETEKGE